MTDGSVCICDGGILSMTMTEGFCLNRTEGFCLGQNKIDRGILFKCDKHILSIKETEGFCILMRWRDSVNKGTDGFCIYM